MWKTGAKDSKQTFSILVGNSGIDQKLSGAKRIPVAQRTEAAVIAWMRHQTTGYDGMVIPRVMGKRREVRRMLARRSHDLLERYRWGKDIPEMCPLQRALVKLVPDHGGPLSEHRLPGEC